MLGNQFNIKRNKNLSNLLISQKCFRCFHFLINNNKRQLIIFHLLMILIPHICEVLHQMEFALFQLLFLVLKIQHTMVCVLLIQYCLTPHIQCDNGIFLHLSLFQVFLIIHHYLTFQNQ